MTLFLAIAAGMAVAAFLLLAVPAWRHAETRASRWLSLGLLGALLPLGGAGMYLMVSNWQWDEHARTEATVQALRTMAAQAEQDLALGDDLEGWRSLGKFYMGLHDYAGAARAYARAYELVGPHDVALAMAYAEALALSDPETLSGKAGELVERVLRVQPNDPRALWYGGLAAYSAGHITLAQQRWARLLEFDPPPALARLIEDRLDVMRDDDGTQASASMEANLAAPHDFEVEVSVAGPLIGLVGEQATLYLIVRDQRDAPPLAVQRATAASLPTTFRISDNDVMVPGRALAQSSGPFQVMARISQSGDATRASGDLYGEAGVSPGERVSIVVDRVVP